MFQQKFPYRKLRKIEKDGQRKYVISGNDAVHSVTTILQATANKEHLENWRERVGHQEADRITTESANLGTLLHKHIENFLLGEDRPSGTNLIRKMAAQMADRIIYEGLINLDEVWGLEATVYAEGLYAGTADLIGVYRGKESIIDFKTTRKMKKEEWIDDYKHQLAAYSLSHNEMFNTNIEQTVILMVSRDMEFQEFIVNGANFWKYAEEWGERLEKFYSTIE